MVTGKSAAELFPMRVVSDGKRYRIEGHVYVWHFFWSGFIKPWWLRYWTFWWPPSWQVYRHIIDGPTKAEYDWFVPAYESKEPREYDSFEKAQAELCQLQQELLDSLNPPTDKNFKPV